MDKPDQKICELYDEISDWFDSCRSENKELMEQSYLNLILDNIPSKSSILDLGCGSAHPIASFFIQKGFVVTGLDGAKNMINKCLNRFPSHEWILDDMRKCNLKKRFNAIIAWDSFFHLNHDDQRNMFPIFEKHAKNNCILLFTSGHHHGEVISEMQGFDFYHASLDPKEYRELLTKHGFEVLLYNEKDKDCGEHTVWLARYIG